MASGSIARTRPSRAKAQVKASKNNTADKWIGKKHKAEPGDMVKFHCGSNHIFGNMGIVVGYLSKNVMLVRTFGGNDADYPPQVIQVRNQSANENYQGPNFTSHYQNYVEDVLFRINGNKKVKKKRAPVKFYEVTQETLPGVLAGTHAVPDGHKVVLLPEGHTPEPSFEDRVQVAVQVALAKVAEQEKNDQPQH